LGYEAGLRDDAERAAYCGVVRQLTVAATDLKLAGRKMSGAEALVARLLTPGGLSHAVQLVYVEASGWYTAQVTFVEI
jgi:hypothetical protein